MELWDLYDRDGKKTGEVWERRRGKNNEIPEGRYHLVSDILVKHVDGTFLLVKRDPEKDLYPGYWEASAGGSGLQGEGPLVCAKRELFEETGIKADKFQLISKTFRDKSRCLIYSYLTVVNCKKDAIVLQEGESVDYKWVDATGLIKYSESDKAIKSGVERFKNFYNMVRSNCVLNF